MVGQHPAPPAASPRRRPRAVVLALACAALALAAAACGDSESDGGGTTASAAPEQVTLAVVPAEDAGAIDRQFAPLISYLSERTGVDVRLIPSTSYAAVIEALRADKADIALLGPLSFVIAGNRGVDLEVLGAQIPAKDVAPTYHSYGVVGADSDIASLDQLRGKRVCFADPSSTSGYLYPSEALLEAGIDPQQDVEAVFAGGPDKAAIGAAKGQCDIGFSFDAMVESILPRAGQLRDGDVKVIWRSVAIPGSPVVARTALHADTKTALKAALLSANKDVFREEGLCPSDPEAECGAGAYGYAELATSVYDSVREACDRTKLEACEKP